MADVIGMRRSDNAQPNITKFCEPCKRTTEHRVRHLGDRGEEWNECTACRHMSRRYDLRPGRVHR